MASQLPLLSVDNDSPMSVSQKFNYSQSTRNYSYNNTLDKERISRVASLVNLGSLDHAKFLGINVDARLHRHGNLASHGNLAANSFFESTTYSKPIFSNVDSGNVKEDQQPKFQLSQGTRHQFLRTKLCPFLIRGNCKNEKSCSYAHSLEQLRPLPNLRQTKLCDEIKKGRICCNPCCTYAHAIYELKQPTADLLTYKTTLCFFWKKGKCFNGSKCRFAHGIHELRNANIAQESARGNTFLAAGHQQPKKFTETDLLNNKGFSTDLLHAVINDVVKLDGLSSNDQRRRSLIEVILRLCSCRRSSREMGLELDNTMLQQLLPLLSALDTSESAPLASPLSASTIDSDNGVQSPDMIAAIDSFMLSC